MAEFQNRDPAAPGFWNERFEQGYTPWDQGGVPPTLHEFVRHATQPLATLIPGCGNAHEAALLAQAGWDVTAIDFSAAAVASARAALGEWGSQVQQADFFSYVPARPLQLIYERAFFCALPPYRRAGIAARWAALLPAGALLAGFFYIDDSAQASLKGPPFSIGSAELRALLTPDFELLEQHAVDGSIAVFEGKEIWQVWRRRA
ncbi:MAG: methyltransferase domain-containing protein [Burkholderiales bacterium]|nr:methyltransferase domain-containing protein [Burkholderiales bacterium]